MVGLLRFLIAGKVAQPYATFFADERTARFKQGCLALIDLAIGTPNAGPTGLG